MSNDLNERRQFLEQQLEWSKKQALILEEIETKLYKMRELAEYVLANELSEGEAAQINHTWNELKREVAQLQQELYPLAH
ncbi:hypothetical protein [Halalkalibacterium ligniniphilum]|uniref:hypothetical protein n=1 Tax=Halalkalibacterium ligniniphilum TaxID=1134413 RepID=UPI00034674CC|nr:hypothetical protein [Halalkalibacterium ligniniphilum]